MAGYGHEMPRVELEDFIGPWRDSMGNSVEVAWAKSGNRGGQLDVVLKKPRGHQDPIRLNVKQHSDGHITCGHYNLAEQETRPNYIVWEDYRSGSRRSVWTRGDAQQEPEEHRHGSANGRSMDKAQDSEDRADDRTSWEELKKRWRSGEWKREGDGVNAIPVGPCQAAQDGYPPRSRSRSPRGHAADALPHAMGMPTPSVWSGASPTPGAWVPPAGEAPPGSSSAAEDSAAAPPPLGMPPGPPGGSPWWGGPPPGWPGAAHYPPPQGMPPWQGAPPWGAPPWGPPPPHSQGPRRAPMPPGD